MNRYGTAFGLALALAFGTAGFGLAQDSSTEAPAEIQLPPPPTHWKADKPVGTSAGPVTAEMLAVQSTPPDRWIQYGATGRGFRHSPLKTLTPQSVKKLTSPGRSPPEPPASSRRRRSSTAVSCT